MLPRFARDAQLALPELIRLHENRKRDMFVSRGAPIQRAYLSLDRGKYLIDKSSPLRRKYRAS